jgi:uncharacterized protein
LKYLLLLLLVLYGLWRWREGQVARRSAPKHADQPQTIEMVACAHCGVHLPVAQALAGGNAYFLRVQPT